MLEDLAEDWLLSEDLENKVDIQLLEHVPAKLLLKYQWLIQFLVAGYVKRGFLSTEEQADLAQDLNAKLLETHLSRMQERYDGRSLVRTYLGVVVRSLISDHLKQKRTQKANLVEGREQLPEARLADENQGPNWLLVNEEIRRLESAFSLVPRIKHKLVLCLKLLVRHRVTEAALREYHPLAPKLLVSQIVQALADYKLWDDKDVWHAVVPLVNDAEGGDPIGADSLRRWVRRRVEWLVAVMNGDPPRAQYSDDSLVLLMEMYFHRRAQQVSE